MNHPVTITIFWISHAVLLWQTSTLIDSLIFTFISVMAFALSSALLVGTVYWYRKANTLNEEIAALIKENKSLKKIPRRTTLKGFINQQMVELSDILNDRFTLEEIKQVMFEIDVQDQWSDVKMKPTKIRYLLEHLKNRNQLYLVESWIDANRPDILEEEI